MSRRMILPAVIALLGSVVALLPEPASAQRRRVPEIRLEQGRELRMPFASVRSIRELSDGTLLVSDPLERAVYQLNRTGTRRAELGPGGGRTFDYTVPAELLPLAGDSTLLWDQGRFEYVVINPEGAEAGRFRLEAEAAYLDGIPPAGTDTFGGIYLLEPESVPSEGDGSPEHTGPRIFRYDRSSGQLLAITRLQIPVTPMGPPSAPGAGEADDTGTVLLPVPTPYQPADAWGVARDGRVAVARATIDRVEWFGSGGALMSGPTLHNTGRALEPDDPEQYLSAWRTAKMREGFPREDVTLVTADWVAWPDTVPPFPGGFAPVDPWGNLWLPLSHPGDPVTRFALIDGQGNKRAEITLPLHTRLQGFGEASLYLVRVDGVGLEWIQRYEWPVAGVRRPR